MKHQVLKCVVLGVALVALVGCQSGPNIRFPGGPPSVPELVQYQAAGYTNRISVTSETLPVRSIAYLESNRDIVSIPPMEAYIRGIMREILEIAPNTSLDPITLNVVITSDPITTAFINPRGDIVISLGALERLNSRGELAFLLALEVAHVALGHFERDRFVLGFDRLLDSLKFVAIAQEFAEAIIENRAGELSNFANEPQIQIKVRQLLVAATAAELLLEAFVGPQWRSSQEAEADRFALDMMLTLGYAPASAQRVFNQFGLATVEQVEQLQDLIYTVRDLVLEIQELSGQNEGIRGLVITLVTDLSFRFAARSINGLVEIYGTPEERFERLREYRDVAYTLGLVPIPEILRPTPTDDFSAAKNGATFRRAVREVTGPWDALAEFTQDQSEAREAAALAGTEDESAAPADTTLARLSNQLVGSLLRFAGVPTQTTQYPRLVYAENAMSLGQSDQAIRELTRAQSSRLAGPAISAALVQGLAEDGQYVRARESIEVIERRFPGDGTQYPLRMIVAHEQGNIVLREELSRACGGQDVAQYIDDRCELLDARYRMADRFDDPGDVPSEPGTSTDDAEPSEAEGNGGGGFGDFLRSIPLPEFGT